MALAVLGGREVNSPVSLIPVSGLQIVMFDYGNESIATSYKNKLSMKTETSKFKENNKAKCTGR